MKTVFLTGKSGEIGQAIFDQFAQREYQIIAPTRKEMDLEKDQSIEQFMQTMHNKIDVFIHCAGFNEPKLISDISSQDILKTMQINALSFYQISHFLLN